MSTHVTDTDIARALRHDCVGDYRERRHWQMVREEDRIAARAERLSIQHANRQTAKLRAILAAAVLGSIALWGIVLREVVR